MVLSPLMAAFGAGDPALADFDVRSLHGSPGDAMRSLFITRMRHKSVIERLAINILRMRRRRIWHARCTMMQCAFAQLRKINPTTANFGVLPT